MSNIDSFYLVKILDEKWADKLLDGEIFMRPLSAFGDLSKRGEDANNTFRGDSSEGMGKSFSNPQESHFFSDITSKEDVSNIAGYGQIAECFLQEKIYSLYCLEYSESNSEFIEPKKQLLEFGDTAIIIFDSLEFLRRVFYKLLSDYGESFWAGAKRVQYVVDLTKLSEYNEFSKSKSYSWQNEFRVAIDLSEGKADKEAWESMTNLSRIMFSRQGGKFDMNAERIPITLKIGDVRDICVKLSTKELVELKLPFEKFLVKPILLKPIEPPRKPIVTSYKPVIIWK